MLIGLSEAVPFLAVSLYAGHVADIVDRKKIIIISKGNRRNKMMVNIKINGENIRNTLWENKMIE